jgi:hypothetical protein
MMLIRLTPMMKTTRFNYYVVMLCREVGARGRVAAAFVTLHITSYAESFSTAGLWALVGLLSSVAVAVDPQATRS